MLNLTTWHAKKYINVCLSDMVYRLYLNNTVEGSRSTVCGSCVTDQSEQSITSDIGYIHY